MVGPVTDQMSTPTFITELEVAVAYEVEQALKGLTVDEQRRVLRAVCALLDIPEFPELSCKRIA